jgi:hypothetical protein
MPYALNLNPKPFVYACDGSSIGQEKSQDAWTLRGEQSRCQLPVVAYGESEPFYGAVPLDKPFTIQV